MRKETECLHAGYTPKNGEPRVVPIVQSTTYCFDSTEHIAALFDMPTECMYSRFANPTCDAVEKKIAVLEGGVGAMLTTSGQAACLLSILNLCNSGDSFIACSTIYGGTVNLFSVTEAFGFIITLNFTFRALDTVSGVLFAAASCIILVYICLHF